MKPQPNIVEELMREIARYLAAVDVFRDERCEPTWRPERAAVDAPATIRRQRVDHLPSAH